MEIFREEVARYRVLMSSEIDENSIETLNEGGIPKLRALRLHNGTIYTWNRACYGITEGKPHLRIENRVLPSGPTVLDEMANTALWLGLMHGMPKEYEKIHLKADFEIVKTNFIRAAKMGMGSMFRWVNNKVYSAQELMLKELIPIAKEGLTKAGVNSKDISKYIDVIQERAETGKSGSQWILDSFNTLKKKGTKDEAIVATTAGIVKRQKSNKPVAKWSKAKINEAGSWINRYWRIDQIMSRNLYTVQEEDLIDLAPNIMSWKEIRDLPVENDKGDFVGLLTVRELLHYFASTRNDEELVTIGDVMQRKVITITEEESTIEAISLLRRNKISSLPVLNAAGKLVGIVTERDFVNVADHFLQEFIEVSENAKSE
jgi:CBS domain-containing protein